MKEAVFTYDRGHISEFSVSFFVELDDERYYVDLGYSDSDGFDIDVEGDSGETISTNWFVSQMGYADKDQFGADLTDSMFEPRVSMVNGKHTVVLTIEEVK